MEVLAKGQLSYMILSCLCERDMYGLELIDEIKKRFGREIKLPSLYSNINRMKELKYISSYLKESTKGPKCSYSSITEAGREALESLKQDFKGLSVVKPVAQPAMQPKPQPVEEKLGDLSPNLQQDEFESEENLEQNDQEFDQEEFEQADDYDDYFNLADDEPQEPTFVMQSKIDIDNLDQELNQDVEQTSLPDDNEIEVNQQPIE